MGWAADVEVWDLEGMVRGDEAAFGEAWEGEVEEGFEGWEEVQSVPAEAAAAAALAEVEREEVDFGRVLAEWARKAARKLEKKGRLLVMLGI